MSGIDLERQLRQYLADGPLSAPSDIVEHALAEARSMPQARTLELPWLRLPPLGLPEPRQLATAALSVALVLVVIAGLWGLQGQPLPPAESPSPSPSVSPSIAPPASPPPVSTDEAHGSGGSLDGLHWMKVATIDGNVEGVLSFGGGYIAYGYVYDGTHRLPWAWHSPDGIEWRGSLLGQPIVPCPDWTPVADSTVLGGASSDAVIVLVGEVGGADQDDCAATRSIAWVSSDGTNWQRSAAFGPADSSSAVTWTAEGGWEAVSEGQQTVPPTIWRSDDGLTWSQVGGIAQAGSTVAAGTLAPSGRRVVVVEHELVSTVLTSDDGLTWGALDGTELFGGTGMEALLAPIDGGASRWLIVHGGREGLAGWSSTDLADWQNAPFPAPYVWSVANTRHGFVAAAIARCFFPDSLCTDPESDEDYPWETVVFVSLDGLSWTAQGPLAERQTRFAAMTDGPLGVLAVEDSSLSATPGAGVWLLRREPSSD